jgi:hypothetical protein
MLLGDALLDRSVDQWIVHRDLVCLACVGRLG